MIKLKDLYPNQASFMKEEYINENKEIDKVYGDFEVLLKDFEKEFISFPVTIYHAYSKNEPYCKEELYVF